MRVMPRVLTHACLAFLAACASRAQAQEKPASTQPSDAASRPADEASRPASGPAELAARALLRDASARRAKSGEPKVSDLTIELDAETDVEQHNEFTASHLYLRPNKIRTKLKTGVTTILRGFDGSTYWLQKDGGKTQRLEGREFAKDRNEIETSIRFTENVLRLVFLATLEGELSDLQKIEPTAADPRPGVRGNHPAFLALRQSEPQRSTVELRFDPKTLDLVEVRATPFEALPAEFLRPKSTDVFEFSDYREEKGVRFPRRITAYSKDKNRPEYKVAVTKVSWNDGLTPEAFAPPK
jgi:hypothetical protein